MYIRSFTVGSCKHRDDEAMCGERRMTDDRRTTFVVSSQYPRMNVGTVWLAGHTIARTTAKHYKPPSETMVDGNEAEEIMRL
jgi:hypothetical protein